jgi:hypothetical protein
LIVTAMRLPSGENVQATVSPPVNNRSRVCRSRSYTTTWYSLPLSATDSRLPSREKRGSLKLNRSSLSTCVAPSALTYESRFSSSKLRPGM